MSDKTTISYEDCTIGANEPIDKYTINRVFRRCFAVAKDRIERLSEVAETPPYAASEDTPGIARFISDYSNANQRAISPIHIMNVNAFKGYSDKIVMDDSKYIRKDIAGGTPLFTKLNDVTANILPNGVKIMTGSFVVGFNNIDLEKLKSSEEFHDMDAEGKDAFYSTMMSAGIANVDGQTQYNIKTVYIPYIDRVRMDEYSLDGHNMYSGRSELSENLFERRMRAYRMTSDVSGERNRYFVESLFNFSFSIQDFLRYCDLVDIGVESSSSEGKYGEARLDETSVHEYANNFYFYRKPVIMVQAIDVAPTYNKFNRRFSEGAMCELEDLEQPINSGVDSSRYDAPKNTAFVENFSCEYDVGESSDLVGGVLNNNLTIGLSSRFVIGDERDNIGYASASKLNHKVKVTFMLIGV